MSMPVPPETDARNPGVVSVVVPCHNEEGNIRELYRQVRELFEELTLPFELVLVDDGSRDGTADVIRALVTADERVQGLVLSRNFGHQAALSAGCDSACGVAVVTMDADLQHPPAVLREFIRLWQDGYDVVYAYRDHTKTRLGYSLYNWLCQVTIPAESADFRLMSRAVVDAFRAMPERQRFVRGMIAWLGFRQIGVPYTQPGRFRGAVAYTAAKRLRLRIDSILSFSTLPLRLSVWLGCLTLTLGILYAAYILATLVFVGRDASGVERGWPAIILTVLLLGGVQLICLGVVAEYIGRIYEEVKHRPLYVVREYVRSRGQSQAKEC